MLATSTYCSGSHGDHSHPTLDLGKSYSIFTPLFLAWHKSSPPPTILRCVREGGTTVKGDTTSKQMKLQTKRTCKTEICISFSQKKNSVSSEREWFRMYWPRLSFKDFGWDMIKNIKEISIASNKTMLIMWLKIFPSSSCCCGKLDHWTGSPARLRKEWINKLCFQMNLGTLISFYCDFTQFILMIVSY